MRPSKTYRPGPSLEGNEAAAPQRVFRKGRFMDVPSEGENDAAAEAFVVDLTQAAETTVADPAEVAADRVGAPASKYEARSLSATVKRDAQPVEAPADDAPVRIEIDIAEPVVAPAKAWTSESSRDGDQYWRKDSRR